MLKNDDEPEKKIKKVTDFSARLLADAVKHFSLMALESPVKDLLKNIRNATDESVIQQKNATDLLRNAFEPIKRAPGIVDQIVKSVGDAIYDKYDPLLSKIEEVSQKASMVEAALLKTDIHKELNTINERIQKIEVNVQNMIWKVLIGSALFAGISTTIIVWVVMK